MGTKWSDQGGLGDSYINIYKTLYMSFGGSGGVRSHTPGTYSIQSGTWLDKDAPPGGTRHTGLRSWEVERFKRQYRTPEAAMKAAEAVFGKVEWQPTNEHGTLTGYAWVKDNPHLKELSEAELVRRQAQIAERKQRAADRKKK